MIKLVKILNSGSNQPEPLRMPASGGFYTRGNLVKYSFGAFFTTPSDEIPDYIVGESKSAGADDTLLCYPVTSDMIFEAECCETPISDMLGSPVELYLAGGATVGVCCTPGVGHAYVYDMMGATKMGDKVLVRFY